MTDLDSILKISAKKVLIVCVLLVALITGSCGVEQVDAGHRGVKLVWGEVDNKTLLEGIYWYNPISSDIVEMDSREQVQSNSAETYSKDVQKVKVGYTLNWYPEREYMHVFFREFGHDYAEKIIPQIVYGTMKQVIGKHVAVDLISQRQAAVDEMSNILKEELMGRHIHMTRFELVELTFDPAFEKAVENKVIAIQQAEESKNKTVRIQEEANQLIIAAEAEATSMKIRSQALSQNKNLIEYEAVLKWDGELPQYMMGSSVPFININGKY